MVLDSASRKPVVGARVVVLDSAGKGLSAAATGSDGRFSFHLPSAGDYRLRISRIGYPSRITEPIGVSAVVSASVVVRLTSTPISLDTLIVVAAAVEKRPQFLVDAGFYRRQRVGFGHFLTRDEIDKRDPLILSDLLQGMSGVRVACTGARRCTVTMRAANTMFFRGKCNPSVVLDGVVLQPGGTGGGGLPLDDLVDPFNIEALEVYPGPEGVPVQYSGYLSPCGAILVWSRR
ncbi:MAG TPA: carboxypeptidase regulatory-like domain-containing protein [Gemmatimonadales bacterium]|nr:carboxypeptidase regulatory-like domain-containing protein [Gemmatimonadales bacterium]